MARGLFVTGTGTDVGKTYVTGLIVKKLRESGRSAAYYKAAMSGCTRALDGELRPDDALAVRAASGIEQPPETMCPFLYEMAAAPHLAARREGPPVQLETVARGFERLCERYDFITVEGSGGILCPLRLDETAELWLEDVIRALGLGCLIVSESGLGAINGVALTAEYLRARGIDARGIILNRFHPGDALEEDNRLMCELRTGLKVVACVREGGRELEINAAALAALYNACGNGGAA